MQKIHRHRFGIAENESRIRQQQQSRQDDRADGIDMPERIEADAAGFLGGIVAEISRHIAVRGFVQSAARELWPKGIHVAHVVVDGIIASDKTDRAASNETRTHLDPDEIAEAYWYLANQPRSAWTLELDLRPNGEEFFT